jgi:prepilin-type N-terminal cleavage/methylation domain-containing protein
VLSANRRRRLERRDEQGFTIIEVMIATAILLIILAMTFQVLVSLTNSENRAQHLVSNEQNVRFELDQLAREVRASNQLVPLLNATTASTYNNQIEMLLGPTGGAQQVIRWTYDTVAERIARQVMSDTSSSATILSQSFFLTRVRNVESNTPLFTYYGQSNQNLVAQTLANNGNKNDAANCAVRVAIQIISDSNPGPVPFTETQDVELRNRLPGNWGCG